MKTTHAVALGAAIAIGLIAGAGVAYAQPDANTHGVPVAQANAACAGIAGKQAPADAMLKAAVDAYNTVSNTDDAAFSAIPAEFQKHIIAVEDHADYLAMTGLKRGTITCNGATAVFPDLALAEDVQAAVCANARLDLIAAPALRTRVDLALKALGRGYQRAHSDCTPPTTTPTTTPSVTPTPTPPPTPTAPDDDAPEFATCAEASAAGVFDIPASDPNYRADMDSDSDGIACERPDAALDGGEQVPVVPNAVDTGRA